MEGLDRGAVENWLVRMLRYARSNGVQLDWTFYCALGRTGELDETARSLGARVVHSPAPIAEKVAFVSALRTEAKRGAHDVLHCHHDLVSALYLAATAGLPLRRLVHVHNADEAVLTPNRLKRWLYKEPARRLCLAMADRIVGISNHTLDTFLAGRRRRPGRDVVHYYGVDPAPFRRLADVRAAVREELRLPRNAPVLLFAGRMAPEKNPLFAVEVLWQVRQLRRDVVGLFVGAGSEEKPVRQRVAELGLEDAVRLLGWRDDVPRLMAAADWFILPRPEQPMEGFGLAVVEAQLAGARLLLSRGIPDDVLLPTARAERLPLDAGAAHWASAALSMLDAPAPSGVDAVRALERSPMALDFALRDLQALHA